MYDAETAPLLDYYAERGLLARIDANRPVDEVTSASVAALRVVHGRGRGLRAPDRLRTRG